MSASTARLGGSEALAAHLAFDEEAIEMLADRVAEILATRLGEFEQQRPSPFMTVPEAANFLRCDRQRIDDLLSQRKLSRVKDGRRTLIERAEIERYLSAAPQPAQLHIVSETLAELLRAERSSR